MKIAILGTGGVGGLVGGLLAKGGHPVALIARGEHLKALQNQGLTVESTSGNFKIPSVTATSDASKVGPADLVLICVKTWQFADAMDQLRSLVGPETLLLPLENGVESSEILTEFFPKAQVLRGLCAMVSFVKSPGVISHSGPDPFVAFGELDGTITPRMENLFSQLNVPGIRLKLPSDIIASQWQKFIFIASMGVISALVRLPLGRVRSNPETRQLIVAAMREVEALARANGVKLPEDTIEKGLGLVDEMPAEGTTSMQRDFMAGRRSELESFSGYIVRNSEHHGLQSPIHQTCYRLLLPLELQAR